LNGGFSQANAPEFGLQRRLFKLSVKIRSHGSSACVGFTLERAAKEITMTDHVYKIVELVGSSSDSTDQAIRNALERASTTLRNLDWFEVVETRGHIVDGKVGHFQVKLKVGFRLEDES
jgi:flavin-binding protein dodecin